MTPEESPAPGRIVVGVDGSPSSLDALSWAARQAHLTGSSLEVVMTWEWPSSYGWAAPIPDDFDPEEEVRRSLEAAVASVRAAYPDLSIDPRVVSGHPAPILVEASKGADLLVVGQPGPRRVRGDAPRLGQRVLRHERALPGLRAPGDVVDDGRRRRQDRGGRGRLARFGRALEWAAAEAERTGASLRLVSAWMFPMALGYAFTTTVDDVRRSAQDAIDRAMARVADVAPGVPVSGETVEEAPAPALVAAAAAGAELLVVGSRGLGGFQGLLMGSVSQYCTRHATCSVVVVR